MAADNSLMNSDRQGYYSAGDMSLKFLEIGIALSRIDRMNPGKIPFCIPVLTPDMNQSKQTVQKVVQKSRTNILTENAGAVDVSNIEVSNYIYIEIPKELTCLPAPVYDIEGTVTIKGSGKIDISGNMAGSGMVSDPGNSFSVSGTVSGSHDISIIDGHIEGTIKTELNPSNRYIESGSKWLIAFIGGDASMPRVVCRLPNN